MGMISKGPRSRGQQANCQRSPQQGHLPSPSRNVEVSRTYLRGDRQAQPLRDCVEASAAGEDAHARHQPRTEVPVLPQLICLRRGEPPSRDLCLSPCACLPQRMLPCASVSSMWRLISILVCFPCVRHGQIMWTRNKASMISIWKRR